MSFPLTALFSHLARTPLSTDAHTAAMGSALGAVAPHPDWIAPVAKPMFDVLTTKASGVLNLVCGLGMLFEVQKSFLAKLFTIEAAAVLVIGYLPALASNINSPVVMLMTTMLIITVHYFKGIATA